MSFNLDDNFYDNINQQAMELLKKMLIIDPSKRITAK